MISFAIRSCQLSSIIRFSFFAFFNSCFIFFPLVCLLILFAFFFVFVFVFFFFSWVFFFLHCPAKGIKPTILIVTDLANHRWLVYERRLSSGRPLMRCRFKDSDSFLFEIQPGGRVLLDVLYYALVTHHEKWLFEKPIDRLEASPKCQVSRCSSRAGSALFNSDSDSMIATSRIIAIFLIPSVYVLGFCNWIYWCDYRNWSRVVNWTRV